MVSACDVYKDEEADEMGVVVMPYAVVYPRTTTVDQSLRVSSKEVAFDCTSDGLQTVNPDFRGNTHPRTRSDLPIRKTHLLHCLQ